jgi:hypothetical protein
MELISCGQLTGPLPARDVPLVMAAGLLPRYDWVRQRCGIREAKPQAAIAEISQLQAE